MDLNELTWVPAPHRAFLERALPVLVANPLVVGIAAGGSLAHRAMDEESDLDLLIVTHDADLPTDAERRTEIANALGPYLGGFTGEHVGEPRLLICLYGDPLLHVDLKFVLPQALTDRVEDPVVLFDRDGTVSATLGTGVARYPTPDRQWIEDRFWIWIHYAAGKLRRGELMEAKAAIDYFLANVFGQLAALEAGHRATGLRRIESSAPARMPDLAALCVPYDRDAIREGLLRSVDLYRSLRREVVERSDLERASVAYLAADGKPNP